ncbi:MAG: RNA recognition motif domain-containing protein [Candidatus Kapaibacterium sp.]
MAEVVAEKEAPQAAAAINKKLYVGSLPYSWTVEQLEELFKPFGRVSSTAIVSDQVTRKSKGFGFVEMESEDAAKKAMEALNGKEIEGRPLSVREAKPNMDKRGGRDGGGNSGGGGGWQPRGHRAEYNDPNGTDTSGRSYGNRNGWW